jgi:hypothetical protein
MGSDHTGNSPLRSKKPAHMDSSQDMDGASGIDFSQYQVAPSNHKGTMNSKFSKHSMTLMQHSPSKRPPPPGGVDGDIYLNERLKALEA